MILVTVSEFAKQTHKEKITVWSAIQQHKLKHIDMKKGTRRPPRLYELDDLKKLFENRKVGRPKNTTDKRYDATTNRVCDCCGSVKQDTDSQTS
jgi:hypothetical protein